MFRKHFPHFFSRPRSLRLLVTIAGSVAVASIVAISMETPKSASASTVTTVYSSATTWTVPSGVTSLTVKLTGGAGGRGGSDSQAGGSAGAWGVVVVSLPVSAGNVIGIYPGGSGTAGASNVTNWGGGSGGTSSYSSSYNGGNGGNAGWAGTSGAGGGGGAASVLTKGGVIQSVAGGAGGGGGGANFGAGGAGTGGATGGDKNGAYGTQCGQADGGGGGGGGGAWGNGGLTQLVTNGWSYECRGLGGNYGANQSTGDATLVSSSTSTSDTAGRVTITYTMATPSTPDLTAASDSGSSSTDNITNDTTPTFTGTATGGSTVQLRVNGNANSSCGTANASTGAWSCTATTLAGGTYAISVSSTLSGVTVTSGSLNVTIDTAAPTATLPPGSINNSSSVNARSSEVGIAYLVNTSVTVTNQSSITGASDSSWNQVNITSANTNTALSATGLSAGTYKLYAVDTAGNLSSASAGTVTLDAGPPTATWTSIPSTPSSSRSLTYTLSFSESVSGIAASDFTIGDGSATGCVFTPSAASTSSTITVTVTCSSDGTVVATLASGSVADTAGNNGPPTSVSASIVTIESIISVTYDTQGGSSVTAGTTLIGGTISLSPGSPSRDGYTFDGWFTASTGGTAITFPYTHGQTQNFTLYAQWSPNTLTVTYNSQGGTAIISGSTVTGGSISASPGSPTRTGYSFDGWFTASTGGTAITFPYTHGQTQNFTLYAQWSPNTLTYTYYTNDGTGTGGKGDIYFSGTTFTGGTLIEAPTGEPSRTGFNFVGWSPKQTSGYPLNYPYTHGRTQNFELYALWRSVDAIDNTYFYTGPGDPGISGVTAPNTLTPAWPRSTEAYEVTATIALDEGAEFLDTVRMCWYWTGTDSSCVDAATNPETQFQIEWTQSTDLFAVTGDNHYQVDAAADSGYIQGASTMAMSFMFKISNAMRAGSEWNMKIIVLNDAGSVISSNTLTGITVQAFSEMTTARSTQNFGYLTDGKSVTIDDFSAGAYVTNISADFTISATPFQCDGCPGQGLELKGRAHQGGDNNPPGKGKVAFECSLGSAFDADSSLRITPSPQSFGESLAATGEDPVTSTRMSCKLTYGGGAARAFATYRSVITFGLVGSTPG